MNRVVIGLGSNIEPDTNIQKAKDILANKFSVIGQSQFIRTKPIGKIQQPDFINGAVLIETEFSVDQLKAMLNQIEVDLGRLATDERFGPRTIDFDIVVWNNRVVDEDFYARDYLKTSVLELIPELKH